MHNMPDRALETTNMNMFNDQTVISSEMAGGNQTSYLASTKGSSFREDKPKKKSRR